MLNYTQTLIYIVSGLVLNLVYMYIYPSEEDFDAIKFSMSWILASAGLLLTKLAVDMVNTKESATIVEMDDIITGPPPFKDK